MNWEEEVENGLSVKVQLYVTVVKMESYWEGGDSHVCNVPLDLSWYSSLIIPFSVPELPLYDQTHPDEIKN